MKTKQSWSERIKKRNKLGFSLVELVVVIAIMAIMTAVLAPSLLSYVERSRAQKDDSAMSEVVNSIQLALADQNVYDEVLCYTCDNIKSCYVDKASPSDTNREETKNYGNTPNAYEEGDHFIYNDNERLADESGYVFAGLMRGVTITFEPERSSNKTAFVLYNGYINAAGHATGTGLNYLYGSCPETEKTSADMVTNGYTENMMLLGNMHSFSAPTHNYLYNRIRATVGDRIELTSQTYRNSCYTIFIRMGTTGGNQADKQDAIMVYGQWSGTNLSASEVGQGTGSSEIVIGGGQHKELTTLTAKTWNGLTDFSGASVWTDGTDIYYSSGDQQYVLNGDTWEPKTWGGLASFYSSGVWTYKNDVYYSGGGQQYVLNGDTWEPKTWGGDAPNIGGDIWTDGTNCYYSYNRTQGLVCQYVLKGNAWETKTWSGLDNPGSTSIWTDGTDIYYSSGDQQYVLNGDTWEPKTWGGLANFYGQNVWTDGTDIYYSYGLQQYVLNGDTWEPKTWGGLALLYGGCVWTDGTNYYYSRGTEQYVFS